MQQGNEFIVGGADCCKTNSGKHIVDDHCRYCGQVDVVKQEVERLRAALRDVAQHYWWKDETKDLIDELFAEQAGGGG